MRNKRLTILIITLLLLILLVVITHCFKKRNSVNDIEIISYDNSSINTICQFDDNYYYTINNEIYNNEKCVMSSEGNKLIYANDNAMFVYSNGVITGYGSDFSIISEYPISSRTRLRNLSQFFGSVGCSGIRPKNTNPFNPSS